MYINVSLPLAENDLSSALKDRGENEQNDNLPADCIVFSGYFSFGPFCRFILLHFVHSVPVLSSMK